MAVCEVCFRRCSPAEGERGACGARISRGGSIRPVYYGKLSSLALDPIEKKPLAHFYPGSMILSAGSLGCNLHCPFCQNHEIAQAEGGRFGVRTDEVSPEKLTELAEYYRRRGNIGIAFTYNEPLVGYEYVRDTAKLAHGKGMKCVLVTNGTASLSVLEELAPYIDAMNIDLKGFTDRYYREVLKGDRGMTMEFIREAVKQCHVELTTLIVPGENDTGAEMLELSGWIAGLRDVYGGKPGRDIPLHVSRFFPRYRMTDRAATEPGKVYELVETARKNLRFVHPGNC
jgi:pyruvate formate lyase activating enzyme